jgi:acyl carrier protein
MFYEREIKNYIYKNFKIPMDKLNEGVSLMESGFITSMGLFNLIQYIEDELNIEIADEDITPPNFGTIKGICEYIEKLNI